MTLRDIYESLRDEDREKTGLYHYGGKYPWSTCPTDPDNECGVSNEHAEKILCWTMVEAMAKCAIIIEEYQDSGRWCVQWYFGERCVDETTPISALHAAYTATFPKEAPR